MFKDKITLRWILEKIGIGLTLSALVMFLTGVFSFQIIPLEQIEKKHIDERFNARENINVKETSNVVVLEITQETYNGIPSPYNRWPWPRSLFAKVVENLNEAGAAAIGIDIIMPNEDKFDPMNDQVLFDAIKKYKNVVVAGRINPQIDHQIIKLDENYNNMFFGADSSIGIVQVIADDDGIYRRYYPFYYAPSTDKFAPTFGIALLNKFFGKGGNYYPINLKSYFIYSDSINIPKYDYNSILVNFYGPSRSFPHYDFINVLDDDDFDTTEEIELGVEINAWSDPDYGLLHSGVFKDKIVLIGSTMPEDKDILAVSISKGEKEGDNLIFGVEYHANFIQSVIDKRFIERQSQTSLIIVVILITTFFFAGSMLLKNIKTKYSIFMESINFVLMICALFLLRILSFYLFDNHSYLFNLFTPSVAVVVAYFAATSYNLAIEIKQKAMIKNMFSQYVSSSIVDSLISNPEKLILGGEKKKLTVLFSDIADFSTFAEKRTPTELVDFLTEYLGDMTNIVLEHKGTLDKFIGDAVMAFWGAPIDQPDHATLACKAALAMQEKTREIRGKWLANDNIEIKMRIGINTGEMVVGNFGGSKRFDYTVMGDSVNLASRLEGVCKEYCTNILIGEKTYEMIKDEFVTREIDYLVVKGKSKPERVRELVALKTDFVNTWTYDLIARYTEGLRLYRNREFEKAKSAFIEVLSISPTDAPSLLFLKRCEFYEKNPPDEEWKGVFKMERK